MKKRIIGAVWIGLTAFSSMVYAQVDNPQKNGTAATATTSKEDAQAREMLTTSRVPTIQLNAKKPETGKKGMKSGSPKKEKDKEHSGNTFFGIKSTKTFVRTEKGKNVILEKFSFVKEYQQPPAHAQEIYFFDTEKRKVMRTTGATIDKEKGVLLHGPYIKTYNDSIVLEQGMYYLGVKHGRWEKFDRNFVLQEKRYYEKGLPRETQITYFDEKKTKIKEIIPIHNGLKNGEYVLYYASGRIAEKGMYVDGVKVGKWSEYYDQVKYARKRETMYAETPYDEKFKSYIIREWDEKGKVIVDNSKRK